MTPDEALTHVVEKQISAAMEEVKTRLSALERSRTADVVAIKELTSQIHDIEAKMDRLTSNFRTLSGQFDSVLANFDTWRRDLMTIMTKLATLDERSHVQGERLSSLQEYTIGINDKFDELPVLVGKAIQKSKEKDEDSVVPWYADFSKWKEIGVGIAIVMTTIMTAINAAKLHDVPLPLPILPPVPSLVTPSVK
jgi:predicted  nucleic acid-binding Zn-ribbon protein